MTQSCTHCGNSFDVTPDDLKFYADISPTFDGQRFEIPPPQKCPNCRFQNRLLFRNDRNLHHRKSDMSGKQIISIYSPDKPYKVFDQDEWWSDRWDAMDHGRDFDFERTFGEQFKELTLEIPHNSLFTTNAENSYYTNHTLNIKNCYLLFGGGNDQDCLYGKYIVDSHDVLDSICLYSCEWCYEGIASHGCYECAFITNARNCSNCLMVEDCVSCKNCVCCFALQQREYCILNQQLTKEEYEQRLKELQPLTTQTIHTLRERLNELKQSLPHRIGNIVGSEDCTGDAIFNSKNCTWCFDVSDSEDSKFLAYTPKGIHSYDATFTAPDGVQWCYNVASTVGMTNSMSTFLCWYGDAMYYSRECHNCKNCFGCVGLKNKQYCVFNKQFSKEEYERTVARIIQHMQQTQEWGEYFSPQLSLFGYNETNAQEHFPLSKEEILSRGWNWFDDPQPQQSYMGPPTDLPATIDQVDESICQKILACELTGKSYKIIPQELSFLKKLGLPLPRRCPDQRHLDRMNARMPRQL